MDGKFLRHGSAALLLSGLLSLTAPAAAAGGTTPLTTVRIAAGLSSPTYVTSAPGDPTRLFVLEQGGRIRLIKNGTLLATPFLDFSGAVSSFLGETGALGLAFDPNYATNGFFYVSYTRRADDANVIFRYSVTANPDVATSTGRLRIFGPVSQPFSNHNGGCIQISPNDKKLYFGIGDGGSANDPGCRAQNGSTLLGKMLRINLDGTIPADNPFVGNPDFRDEIWAYGLRNPWRFSFDRANGDLYIGDVGQNAREEISFQSGASTGGENFGWKYREGSRFFSTGADSRLTRTISMGGEGLRSLSSPPLSAMSSCMPKKMPVVTANAVPIARG